ncbi:hypothetical protein GKC32_10700 (plasmid) [Lactobacillus curvatus]|nr:hypothetical protein [Latilactobacillus curvatus]MSD84706.1 hypothetical protein [Latilactobacillus curvatus]MSE23442.1 hypothetical protein [Latilactobacillus curvatus]MSE24906.1 hypothetical protein [Latilactobacillus curvatus]
MAKYIAEIQDARGNTVYPATQWGAITNPPSLPNMGNYYSKTEIENNMVHRLVTKGVNGAASPAYLTVDKLARLCTLQIDSRLPINTGTMYWIPKEYATGIGNVFIRTGNATLAVYGNGNVELLSNNNDGTQSIGSTTWGY